MKEIRDITWQSIWRIFLIAIFLVALFYLRSVLIIIFFSIIISSAFDPVVDWFEKKGLGRIFGTILIYLISIILLAAFLFVAAPFIYQEVLGVFDMIPGYSEKIINSFIGSKLGENINQLILNYGGSIVKSGSAALSILTGIVGGAASLVSVLLISFYLLIKRDGVDGFLRAVLPQSIEATILRIWEKTRIRVGKWFRTQLLLSLFIGISAFVALFFLGVKYSMILGILAGLLEIVPIAGPIFAGLASALVALSQSTSLAIWVIVVFIIIHQLESNVLVPIFMKKSIGLNPIIVIIALLAGSKLGGIVGIILAIPVVVVLEETIMEFNRRKIRYLPFE